MNGCPDTWWLDYSDYKETIDEDGDIQEPEINELTPYIDKGVNRICWEVRFKQHNYMKYKWDDWNLRSGGNAIFMLMENWFILSFQET